VSIEIEELYDYDELRSQVDPTMFVVRLAEPTLVLGSSQSLDVLVDGVTDTLAVRRRRGGGGAVLLQPDDLWIDWWIPAIDQRWSGDVRQSSIEVGRWWRDTLAPLVDREVLVHEGPLEGEMTYRIACFAGRGPGEVFVDGRKVVGLTQWRVREGNFASTVLPAHGSQEMVALFRDPPAGLGAALEHHTMSTLKLDDPAGITADLAQRSGPWSVRLLFLTA
jgi:lipoate-protein ligase A